MLHLVKRRGYTIDAVGVSVLGECEDVANARVRFDYGCIVCARQAGTVIPDRGSRQSMNSPTMTMIVTPAPST